jgi:hypothetical protein
MIGGGGGALQQDGGGSSGGFDGVDFTSGGGGGDFDSRGGAIPYIGMYYPDAAGQYAREMEQANQFDNFDYTSAVPEFVNPYASIASDQAKPDQTWANVDPDAYVAPEDPYANIPGYVDRTQVESGIATLPDYIQRADVESGAVATPYVDRTEVESGAVTTPYVDRTEVESGAVTTPYVTRDEVEQGNLDTISRVEPPPETVFVDPSTDNFLNPPDYAVNTGGGATDPNAAMAASIQAGIESQKRANDALAAAAAAAGQRVKSYAHTGDPDAVHTLFGQEATSPIAGTQGKRYAFGGVTDSVSQFNNPFGSQGQNMAMFNSGAFGQQNNNTTNQQQPMQQTGFGGLGGLGGGGLQGMYGNGASPYPAFQNPFGQQQAPGMSNPHQQQLQQALQQGFGSSNQPTQQAQQYQQPFQQQFGQQGGFGGNDYAPQMNQRQQQMLSDRVAQFQQQQHSQQQQTPMNQQTNQPGQEQYMQQQLDRARQQYMQQTQQAQQAQQAPGMSNPYQQQLQQAQPMQQSTKYPEYRGPIQPQQQTPGMANPYIQQAGLQPQGGGLAGLMGGLGGQPQATLANQGQSPMAPMSSKMATTQKAQMQAAQRAKKTQTQVPFTPPNTFNDYGAYA